MSITNFYNDPCSSTFLVAGDDQVVKSSPSAVAAIAINDWANDACNIADKQLGILIKDEYSDRKDTFLVDGELFSDFKKIQLIQGTPYSSNISLVDAHRRGHQAYVKSNVIDGSQGSMSVISKPFTQSYSSAIVLGDIAANVGAFDPQPLTTYTFRVGVGGRKSKKQFSQSSVQRVTTQLALEPVTYTNDVDRFIKRAAKNLNANSALNSRGRVRNGKKPVIVFAVNIVGGDGITLTDVINPANLNTKFTYEVAEGRDLKFEITEDFVATVNNLIANSVLVAASTIEIIDLSVAGATLMAAGAAAADALVVLGLDEQPAVMDDRMETQKTLIEKVGVEGFPNLLNVVGSAMYRGQGRGWQLYNDYQKRALMEIFAEETFPLENRPAALPPVYFADDMSKYNVHEIYHTWVEHKDLQRIERNNRIRIVVPVADTATTDSMNDDGLAEWFNSLPNLTKFTSATAPDLFV